MNYTSVIQEHIHLSDLLEDTVKSLVSIFEEKDIYTQIHSHRVSEIAKKIGQFMKLREKDIKELTMTGLVHDIGKVGISNQLLNKPDLLTPMEYETIKQHPEMGLTLLLPLDLPESVIVGTLLHHKRFDLKGYPEHLQVDRLPQNAAIIGVADAFDAMTSERSYKRALTKQEALLELKTYSGTQFDPTIVHIVEELIYIKAI